MSPPIAWGAKVSEAFRERVCQIAAAHDNNPNNFMACMAFESGETFSPSVRNAAGSGAVGLIQFMPSTAAALGTTTAELAAMTQEAQLEYVADYFRPWTGRLHSLGDVYGAILWPAMIGKPDDYVCFDKSDPNHPKLYVENRGLDFNQDGKITRLECWSRVYEKLQKGLSPANALPA